jgi:adenylate cyclase
MPDQTPTVGMERKLAAIFSTDVAGYSRLMGNDEEATIRTLITSRVMISSLIQQYRGRVVDAPGDNLLAEFASVVDAVRCAVESQHALKGKNAELPAHRQMQFRIGINLGDVIVEGERLYGDGVNIAARLESLAEPGGICISGTAYDHVENKLALTYDYQGEQPVKNIAKPVRVYRVQLHLIHPPIPTQSGEQPVLLPLPDKPSLAVLPFTNLSSDPEQEYFSDGITEDLITELSRLSGLFVIARHSTFTYKEKAVKVQEVSRELGVRYVLEGSVRKIGERVRITAQLVNATTGHHLWAERYDRPLQDIFALQDEIVQKIVTTLKLQLSLWEQGHLVRKTTDNLEAYDFYLRGVEYFYRSTQETNAQARQMFEQALALDPQYAETYARLGWNYSMGWTSQWSQDPQDLEQAFELVQKALARDPFLPLAHRVLGWVSLWRKQYAQAIAAAKRAVALAPNDAEGYARLGEILNFAGRPEEAIRMVEKAMRLNPRSPAVYLFYLGHAYCLTGRYEEAIAVLKGGLPRNPDFLPTHIYLAAIYSELGREAEARTEVAEVIRLSPPFSLEVHGQKLPYKDPAILERHIAALRKAGLK